MRSISFGRIVFAVSMMLAGALSIAFHDFALVFGEVPKTAFAHDALVMASAIVLLLGGAGLLAPPTVRIAALVLTIELFLITVLRHVRPVVMHPLIEGSWYALGETMTLVCGAWVIFSMQPSRPGDLLAKVACVRGAQVVFGLSLIPLGLAHMVYMNMTAPLIPSYIPFHVPLGYATGAFHIAAGLAIVFRVVPLLAAALETAMVGLFTLLIWVPAVLGTPKPFDWIEFCASLAVTGAAWVVAESFRAKSNRLR